MIAANFKLHKTNEEVAEYLRILQSASLKERDILVCPSYVSVITGSDITNGSDIMIGAQDISQYDEGAYTGDVSGKMLKGFCKYVIVGHSEKRHVFMDSDETVSKKLHMALKNSIIPILCIGETADERDNGQTEAVLKKQIKTGLKSATINDEFIVAYEPVWAISSGNTHHEPATPELAEKQHKYIRALIAEIYNNDTAEKLRILYGGSVKPENVASFLKIPDIDGVLVGSASLNIQSFIQIINS